MEAKITISPGGSKLEKPDGRAMIRLDLERATPIPRPRNPYLY